MQDEFSELTQAFHNAGYDMMTDAEVIEKLTLSQS
jgi:hypothetical protein